MKYITCIVVILFSLLISSTLEQQSRKGASSPQEQRLNQIRRRRKELQEKYAEQNKDNQNFQKDGQLSKTQKIMNQQKQASKSDQKLRYANKKTYLFETQKQMDQFVINIPQDQQIIMEIMIYVIQDNAYGRIKDVDKEAPLRVYVYENNNRIIIQKQFYFQGLIKFQGKKDSTYTVRYYNTGNQKLISVDHNPIVQNKHVQNLLTPDDTKQHGQKAKGMLQAFQETLKDLKIIDAVSNRNVSKYNQKIFYYGFYHVIELIICIGVCFTQVTFIKKLLAADSIV